MKQVVWLGLALVGCSSESKASPASSSVEGPAPSATLAEASALPSASPSGAPTIEYEPETLPELDDDPKSLADQHAAILRRMKALGIADEKKPICKAPFMVPLFRPASEKESDAKTCIDRYEFPGMPCDYPVTWVSTREAQDICHVLGKRLCDAHEWEGGCAGDLLPPEEEYAFGRPRDTMRGMHDIKREIVWAYGKKKDHGKCGTDSVKNEKCSSHGWKYCGSNTYPAGSFPDCKSPFGVYDQHGNAAEHMALPLKREQLGKLGGFGIPEMKGSWFIFKKYEA
ncbi:MAG: SUMF1/EgtB/PvdO family nonheme iron enzyme, partial [Myxococcales bacterium]|nr:SUMF1/EgtB/PvdO family nonheme iron enzyme [Myxococcales bacterium]